MRASRVTLNEMRSRHQPFALLACALVVSCSDALTPHEHGDLVVVDGGEGASIALVDVARDRVAGRLAPIPRFKGPGLTSPDRSTSLFKAGDGTGAWIFDVQVQSLSSAREARIDAPGATHPIDSLYVNAYAMAFSPDGTRLFASGAFLDPWPILPPPDGEFIAVLDPQLTTVLARIGPLQARQTFGLATLPPGPVARRGAILAVGSRRRQGEGSGNTIDQLWVIDPTTYAIIDSLQPEPNPAAGRDVLLTQVVASPDGQHAYVVSDAGVIYECDLAAHATIASVPAFGTGQLAIAPDGQTLYLTDQGDYFDTPGSGQVFVYGSDLSPRPPIDLRPTFGGGVPATHGIAVSPSDTLLYVATGTGSLGPNYGPQPLQLLIIDLTGHTPIRKVPLHDYGTATLQVLAR